MRDLTVKARDGIELAVRDHRGNGPDVLLLHGATRNLEDWKGIVPRLDGLRVVTMDQRFHGLSGVGPPSSPSDWVSDIEAVVAAAEMSNPYIVGWSMGGVNALLYGIEHPECPGVLNIDGYDVRQAEFYDELPAERVAEFLDQFAAMSSSFIPADEGDDDWLNEQVQLFKQMDAAWGVDPAVTEAVAGRAFVQTSAARWERRPTSSFWGTAVADGLAADTLDLLRRVSCPVTVVLCTKPMPLHSGNEFFAASKRGAERHFASIAAERPNVRVVTIDATHGVVHERPAEIAELITSLANA